MLLSRVLVVNASQKFFHTELVRHIDPELVAQVTGSKRQLTYFLSYLARIAAFWSATDALITNLLDMHMGSVLFEQVCVARSHFFLCVSMIARWCPADGPALHRHVQQEAARKLA